MKTIVAAAILAIGVAAGTVGSRAQAETVWHFPYKGVPYATQTTPTVREFRTRRHYERCRYFRRHAGEKHHLAKTCR